MQDGALKVGNGVPGIQKHCKPCVQRTGKVKRGGTTENRLGYLLQAWRATAKARRDIEPCAYKDQTWVGLQCCPVVVLKLKGSSRYKKALL